MGCSQLYPFVRHQEILNQEGVQDIVGILIINKLTLSFEYPKLSDNSCCR